MSELPTSVPARPRLVSGLPLLRRRIGELQIGLDPRHAAVLGGLPDRVLGAVHRLTGDRTGEQALAELRPADRPVMAGLLHLLADHGLLEDAADRPAAPPGRFAGELTTAAARRVRAGLTPDDPDARQRFSVAVQGDGRLAVAVAVLLAGAGVGRVTVTADGTVHPEDTGTGYRAEDLGRTRRAAARDALRRADAGVRTTRFQGGQVPDLVVLTDALVPDPDRVAALTESATPHLLARFRDGTGIVGPLVVPGLTSCLRCADLHRCDRDECWPQLAVQLAGRVQLADLATTQATAAFTAAQALDALAWLHGAPEQPATCEATVELDPHALSSHSRCWSAHPKCSCDVAAKSSHRAKLAADTTIQLRQSCGDGDAT